MTEEQNNKVNEIIGIIFTKDIDDIIKNEEYIGIRLSGGIDSAFMTFLTMRKYQNKKLIPITIYNKLRPDARIPVKKVRECLRTLNPDSILLDPVTGEFSTDGYFYTKEMQEKWEESNYTAKFHPKDKFQRTWFKNLFLRPEFEGKLNILFSGETLNPPIDVQKDLLPASPFPEDRNLKRPSLISKYRWPLGSISKGTKPGPHRYEFRPFRNMNKKDVAELVKATGLDKTLLPLTETCEMEIIHYEKYSSIFQLTYKNPGTEPCKRCWPCREKYWAYGYYDFLTKETSNIFKQL